MLSSGNNKIISRLVIIIIMQLSPGLKDTRAYQGLQNNHYEEIKFRINLFPGFLTAFPVMQ